MHACVERRGEEASLSASTNTNSFCSCCYFSSSYLRFITTHLFVFPPTILIYFKEEEEEEDDDEEEEEEEEEEERSTATR